VLADLTHYPNYGIPSCEGIQFAADTSKCMDLSGADSSCGTAIDLWECNGLVNQAWYWAKGSNNIVLGGTNQPGVCIDLPGGDVYNGNKLQIWGCNGQDSQKWSWDNGQIRYTANPKYCIDVPGGNAQNGNHLWLWECTGGSSQKWSIFSRSLSASAQPRTDRQKVNNIHKKPRTSRSWMHDVQKTLQTFQQNWTRPGDLVPWFERRHVQEWYASQMPKPGFPRALVPPEWKGYTSTSLYV
jgi:hypothetical protein